MPLSAGLSVGNGLRSRKVAATVASHLQANSHPRRLVPLLVPAFSSCPHRSAVLVVLIVVIKSTASSVHRHHQLSLFAFPQDWQQGESQKKSFPTLSAKCCQK